MKQIRFLSALLIAAVILPSCSEANFVGIRYLSRESLEFFVPLCGGDRLQEVRLERLLDVENLERNQLLWRLRAVGRGERLSKVELGAEPQGFTSDRVISLSTLIERYPRDTIVVNAETTDALLHIGLHDRRAADGWLSGTGRNRRVHARYQPGRTQACPS